LLRSLIRLLVRSEKWPAVVEDGPAYAPRVGRGSARQRASTKGVIPPRSTHTIKDDHCRARQLGPVRRPSDPAEVSPLAVVVLDFRLSTFCFRLFGPFAFRLFVLWPFGVLAFFGFLGFWVFGLLGFWAFGFLGFWVFGLLGFWVFGLLAVGAFRLLGPFASWLAAWPQDPAPP
jgi:hypothetical protein